MEYGAEWPSYASDLAGRASSAVVEAQPPSESIEEFSARVVDRIQRMGARKVAIPIAIIAAGRRNDPAVVAARDRIAKAVIEAMKPCGRGELLIYVGEHVSEQARHDLVSFAGALRDGLEGGADINVRVRFATAPSQTGIRLRPGVEAAEPPARARSAL
jgi:hypothetical protein